MEREIYKDVKNEWRGIFLKICMVANFRTPELIEVCSNWF